MKRSLTGTLAGLAMLVMLALGAPVANALVVHLSNGRYISVYLRAGLSATAYEHQTGARPVTPARPAVVGAASADGLFYDGGPVLHRTDPYLVFWDPNSAIPATSRHVMTQYYADASQDSTNPTDVYAYRILSQYTDSGGSAGQGQTFSAGTQAISDTQAYPSPNTSTCTSTNRSGFVACITDAQIQAEVTRLITANSLPSGIGANAPIYFVVTPANVDVCTDSTDCSGGQNLTFCAYHSSYTGPGSSPVIYASIPFTAGADCQDAGPVNPPAQEPNGDVADVITDNMSHENAESITDPLVGSGDYAWLTTNGEEVADQCEAYGPNDPNDPGGAPTSMDAYMPEIGGSQSAGTLYDQLIDGDHYFTQTLWSNSTNNCEATATISPSFTSPGSAASGAGVTFDPTASSSTDGYASTTWTWGDGSPNTALAGAPTPTSHTYTAPGAYTVTLTLVDAGGRSAQVTHSIMVGSPPSAAFSESPSVADTVTPVAFNGAGSSDPNAGQSITGYSWNFGDGSPAGAGATPSHTYASPGTYTVTLTVTGSEGFTATVSHTATVVATPIAVPILSTAHPVAGSPVSFDGTSTGGISTYTWNFGDGATGSGATAKHTYAKPATYTVTLTVTDASGFTSTRSLPVVVAAPGTITGVSLKRIKGKYYLVVAVSRAGTVRFGSGQVRLKRPGKATFKLPQQTGSHKVTIVYTPALGPPVRKIKVLKL